MRGHVQWPPFFSVFWDKYGLFLVGSATLFFDFFFAVITINSSDNHYYVQTPEKGNCSGAHPSLFIGHISVKLKFFFHRRSSESKDGIFKESAKAFKPIL